ncbi:DUF4913 domain-containing protein [Nanchangia anserum]|uniref:DUF4913 domain-containing protein n=1 Tax=Nanchangia anserum TaxID=2692125 RepID=A0A8I0KQA3_9ACTO|nr:DUF4913 domain-containing protein [Nanchangia anserum]MBD3689765.1 DUF4913 domain-containing protein [Nanchangia anserum]QOX81936.1 DUF4913 domain-containing protein [Nanchangia anserum]
MAHAVLAWWDRPADSANFVWCEQWWKHPEAVRRLEALWRVFEINYATRARHKDLDWLRTFDYHMNVLTDPAAGTFRRCRKGHVEETYFQPLTWPPPYWFAPHRWKVGADDTIALVKRLPASLNDLAEQELNNNPDMKVDY